MADSVNPQLSLGSTTRSNLKNLPIVNGQLIFVRDSRTISFDYDDKRVMYSIMMELETDADRTSMLAPVSGIYYYVVETNALWTYRDRWVQITGVTTNSIEANNNRPVTSDAVYKVIGDIERLLSEI